MLIFLKNIKEIFLALFVLLFFAVLFDRNLKVEDLKIKKEEIKRLEQNASQERKSDSLNFSSLLLKKEEINEELDNRLKSLKEKLKRSDIEINKLQSIIHNTHTYRDTVQREVNIDSIVSSIKNSMPKEVPWSDSTKCWYERGSLLFDGKELKLLIKEREYRNTSDVVSYWERRLWRIPILGFKTRVFGKIQLTSKAFDDCGQTRTLKIEKKK